jgi:hypothetical protein
MAAVSRFGSIREERVLLDSPFECLMFIIIESLCEMEIYPLKALDNMPTIRTMSIVGGDPCPFNGAPTPFLRRNNELLGENSFTDSCCIIGMGIDKMM